MFGSMLKALPADVRADMKNEAFKPSAMRTASMQSSTFLDELALWRENPPAISNIPVTIISGGRKGDGLRKSDRAEFNAAHAYRVGQATQGHHVIAPKSGHYVVITEPSLIAKEIQRIVKGRSL